MEPLEPSEASALIIRVELPPALEALRLRHVEDAPSGLPAHMTMLYPFADPASIDDRVSATIRRVVASHAPWTVTLGRRSRWSDALYASVEPAGPAVALQADLASAFPSLPIYGGLIGTFIPHVTVAEDDGVDDPTVWEAAAWRTLPALTEARDVQLIVRDADAWRVAGVFPMRPAD